MTGLFSVFEAVGIEVEQVAQLHVRRQFAGTPQDAKHRHSAHVTPGANLSQVLTSHVRRPLQFRRCKPFVIKPGLQAGGLAIRAEFGRQTSSPSPFAVLTCGTSPPIVPIG